MLRPALALAWATQVLFVSAVASVSTLVFPGALFRAISKKQKAPKRHQGRRDTQHLLWGDQWAGRLLLIWLPDRASLSSRQGQAAALRAPSSLSQACRGCRHLRCPWPRRSSSCSRARESGAHLASAGPQAGASRAAQAAALRRDPAGQRWGSALCGAGSTGLGPKQELSTGLETPGVPWRELGMH